jgi:hypothetical protein
MGQKLNSFEVFKGKMCWIGTIEVFNMEAEKYRIPLFDGYNYPDWKFRMSVYLDELDLLRHIETPLSELLEENPELGNGLVRNDKKCKSRIIQRIEDAQLEYVKGQETAYDVWNNLQDVFEKKGMTSKVMLKMKLLSLKHQPSEETLSEYFLKFDEIIRELGGTGCIMNDTDKVCHLYLSMSDEYEMTVTALRTLPERNQKLAMVKCELLEEEAK